ncbi:MAG TPA: BTAD domain-containing putative transcriptional regulator [Gemmatimonadaceae bacterium]
MRISLTLFGTPLLRADGKPVTRRAAQPHRLALLAVLARHPNGIARDKILALLWPESPEERARNSLNESVYVLRSELGEDAIRGAGPGLRLDETRIQVDVVEFEAAVRRGDLEHAAALYAGPFLDGFHLRRAAEFEHWIDAERDRLDHACCAVLEALAAAASERGDPAAAVDWWRRRAARDPLDARVACALMAALAAAGNRAGALEHARAFTALLKVELGLDSDPEVDALVAALRQPSDSPQRFADAAVGSRGSGADSVPARQPAMQLSGPPIVTERAEPVATPRWARLRVAGLAAVLVLSIVTLALWLRPRAANRDTGAEHPDIRVVEGLPGGAFGLPPARSPRPGSDLAAYELYQEGHGKLARHREADVREAIGLFEAAVARDSAFALAHAGLAMASAEMHLRFATREDAPAWAERAIGAGRTALALDPQLAEVHEALAAVHRKTEFDWDATIRESRKALELNPNLANAYFYMGGALLHLGLLEEAERVVRAGLQVRPAGDRVEALRTLGIVALAAGRYGEAIAMLQDVQRLSDRPVSDPWLAQAYFYAGDVTLGERLAADLAARGSGSSASRARAALAGLLANRGEHGRALDLVAQAARGLIDHHVAYSLGAAHAQLHQPEEAVRWLRTAAHTGFPCYPWFARDPLLDPIRADRAFRTLLAELRTAWERERGRYATLSADKP